MQGSVGLDKEFPYSSEMALFYISARRKKLVRGGLFRAGWNKAGMARKKNPAKNKLHNNRGRNRYRARTNTKVESV